MSGTTITTTVDEIEKQIFEFNEWTIETQKSHILESKCKQKDICDNQSNPKDRCLFCQ